LRIHPLRRADRERLLQLWNEVAVFDPISEPLLEEKIWADDDFASDLALKATVDGEIVGFAVAVVRPSRVSYIKLLAVDRDRQRSGVGRSLVQMLERFVRIRGAKSMRLFESAPNYLVPGIGCPCSRHTGRPGSRK
jgi:predicted N-acetyltransferase YhbS